MNMKKLMAVVLAVVLAISAMAINVFAAEGEVVKIQLRPVGSYVTDSSTAYFNFEAPVYGLFGFVNQNNYLELNLPTKASLFASDWANPTVTWYASTNLGNKVKISPTYDKTAADYTKIYLNFGFYEQGYTEVKDNDGNVTQYWATLRQGTFGEITTVTLTAEVKMPGQGNQWWTPAVGENDLKNTTMYMQLWTAGADGMKTYGDDTADERVTGSILFSANMNVTKTTDAGFDNGFATFEFVSDIEGLNAKGGEDGWNTDATVKTLTTAVKDANGNDKTSYKNIDLVWDMTLAQRAYVINAESARVVVKLATDWGKPGAKGYTNGIGVYSLYVADTQMLSTDLGQLWWQSGDSQAYNRRAKRVSFVNIDTTMGNVTELSFDVPVDKLYNGTYGISAGVASTFRIYAETEVPVSDFNNSGWDAWARNYNHWTNDAYLELTMPAVDDSTEIDAPEPVESNEGGDTIDANEEPDGEDNVDVTEPEPEDTNPPTGIVLAVLPMVVAAAAVVASKRR